MFSLRHLHRLSILAIFVLVGCAQQPLSSIDRSKYKTVALASEMKAPDHPVYRDITGKRSRGIVGGLLGGILGAASEGPGHHRFTTAVANNPVDIRALMRRQIEATFRSSKLLKIVSANPDTTLKIDIAAYGVGPVNERQLGAVILATATLTGQNGKELWKKTEWSQSNTTALLEDIEHNPKLWPQMANEAAEVLSRKMILYTEKTDRTVAEPLM